MDTLKDRLEKHQWRRKNNACWPWLGHIDAEGYGRIWASHAEGSITVQNALWRALGRKIEPGQKVLACPLLKDCTNPNHISIGTTKDIGDRILWKKKLRRREPKETQPIERKLSDEQVRQIFLSQESNAVLAERYGVTKGMISNIRHRRRYRNLTNFEGVTHENHVEGSQE